MKESIDNFFKTNEKNVNSILTKLGFFLTLVYPVLIILNKLKIYNDFSSKYYYLSWINAIFCAFLFFFVTKFRPNSALNKYFLIVGIEICVFSLSILNGVIVYITYVLVVLLSCMYFDHFFTFQVEIISFVYMMISFSLRLKILPAVQIETTRAEWGINHTAAGALEFVLFGIFSFYLTFAIRRSLISLYEHKRTIQNVQNQITFGFANIIEAKDESTGEHIKKTSEYVWLLCIKLMQKGLYPEYVNEHTTPLMVRAAPFHDLGKICIPDDILNKEGILTKEEFSIMQRHPLDGAEFIEKKMTTIGDPELIEIARDMCLCHHEHMDGTGYPNRLIADEIPICARIMTIADILDALLSVRSYKKAYSISESFSIIKSMAGSSLDPVIVDTLLECDTEVRVIRDGGVLTDDQF